MSYNPNLNQPINNNINQVPLNQSPNFNQVTGSEKIKVKSTPLGTNVTGKSSYHNPMTGVSETAKIRSKAEGRSRSRSSSSQRARRNVGTYNAPIGMSNNLPINNQVPVSNVPMNGGSYQTNTSCNTNVPCNYNNTNTCNTTSCNTNLPTSNNFPINSMPVNNNAPLNQPIGNQSVHSDTYARQKGMIKTTNNGTRTTEKLEFVDPITGNQQNVTMKTAVTGISTGGKSKTAYDNKIEGTMNGPEVTMTEKHREGGVLTNLKNKIHNMVHPN